MVIGTADEYPSMAFTKAIKKVKRNVHWHKVIKLYNDISI